MFTWTDEREAELTQLWADGLSASQVAIEMGCVSRSAVIGKVHRLHLPARRTVKASPMGGARKPLSATAKRAYNHSHVRVPKVEATEPLPPPVVDDEQIPIEQRITSVLALEACHCRWPVGEPGKPGFFFCGSPTADIAVDRPYCAPHAKWAKGKPHRYDGAERHTSFRMISGKYA